MGSISILFLIGTLACQGKEEITVEQYLPLLGEWEQFDSSIKDLDQGTRDLLLLRLAVQQPRYSPQLCQRVETENAKEKCKQVIGRPHLTTPRAK